MPKADWQGFVNIRLEKADKEEVKKRAAKIKPAELWTWIMECAMHGYQFSLSPDTENSAFIASLTGKDTINLNAGLSMSQRHVDPTVAIVALMYAHSEMASDACWEDVTEDWRKADW